MWLLCLGKTGAGGGAVAAAPVYSAEQKRLCSTASPVPVSIPRAARSTPWAYLWFRLHATLAWAVLDALSVLPVPAGNPSLYQIPTRIGLETVLPRDSAACCLGEVAGSKKKLCSCPHMENHCITHLQLVCYKQHV